MLRDFIIQAKAIMLFVIAGLCEIGSGYLSMVLFERRQKSLVCPCRSQFRDAGRLTLPSMLALPFIGEVGEYAINRRGREHFTKKR